MGLMFFPRGGSSHVAQNLAAALPAAGWRPTILSGSLSLPGRPGDARAFYRGLDVHTVDFTPALEAPDPLLADPPFHPSFEDREGAPDASSRRSATPPTSTRSAPGRARSPRRARRAPTSCTSTT